MTRKKLIMIMGVQRSGTSALFNSLARDKRLTAFNESVDSAVYFKYRLRALAEVASVFNAAPGAVLLKPISETFYRSLEILRMEYVDYSVQFVWIYRDPVNVIYSMHRQGWLPRSQVDHPGYITEWIRRNRLALQFQHDHPNEIALVRYEDCYADPEVFRQLSRWLGVKGHPLFRKDTAEGRRLIPQAAQQNIDAAAGPTLQALDAARTLRSRRLYRCKLAAMTTLSELSKPWRAKREGAHSLLSGQWDTDISAVATCHPSDVNGLRFWLDAGKKSNPDEPVANFAERGPHRMRARGDLHQPFHIPNLNEQHTFFFPAERATARQQGAPGLVRFGTPDSWKFLFDGTAFSVFALFKPDLPSRATGDSQRAVLLRVGSTAPTPAFILEWDRKLSASKAILLSREPPLSIFAATPPGSHPHHHWRIIHLRYGGRNDAQLTISANGIRSSPVSPLTKPQPGNAQGLDYALELGGNEAQRDALFYGAIAELIIFDRALTASEQFGITRYLKEKYLL